MLFEQRPVRDCYNLCIQSKHICGVFPVHFISIKRLITFILSSNLGYIHHRCPHFDVGIGRALINIHTTLYSRTMTVYMNLSQTFHNTNTGKQTRAQFYTKWI